MRARTAGFDVVEKYTERVDNADSRPRLRRLLDRATTKAFDVVVVLAVGALARSRVGALGIARKLDATGVRGVSAAEPWFDVNAEPLKWIADGERRRAARSRVAIARKRERGEVVGTPPIGYARAEDGSLVEDETEQEMIARARERQAEGCSYSAIARHLTEAGYTSRSGGPVSSGQALHMTREGTPARWRRAVLPFLRDAAHTHYPRRGPKAPCKLGS